MIKSEILVEQAHDKRKRESLMIGIETGVAQERLLCNRAHRSTVRRRAVDQDSLL